MDFTARPFRNQSWHAENQKKDFNTRNKNYRNQPPSSNNSNRNSNPTIDFCKFFSVSGKCNNGNKCRFRHEILRLEESDWQNKVKVTCCEAASKNDGSIEVFVASKNNNLTKWIIRGDEKSGKPKIIYDQQLSFPAIITSCLYYKDCLFCGTDSGQISVLFESGQQLNLQAHNAAIYSMTFVDDILISGDWNGQLKMWEFNNQTNNFQCAKTLETGCKITCLKELTFFLEENNLNIRSLWIGGTKILILDLSTLDFVKDFQFNDHICMSLISFQGNMIAGFAAGHIKVYKYDGEELCQHKGPFLSCIEGMIIKDNPILLHATDRGLIQFIKLPGLEDIGTLWSNRNEIGIKRIINLGQNHFLAFRDDGHISIWKWLD